MGDSERDRQYLRATVETCVLQRRRGGVTLAWLMHWYIERCSEPRTIEQAKTRWINWAIRTGDMDVLHLLYTYDHIPDWGCILSSYDFFLAGQHGHVPVVQFFLDTVPCLKKPSHTCKAGRGLRAAARGGWLLAAKLLLDYGARVNSTSGAEGAPPLFWAVKKENVELVVMLLAHGATVMRNQRKGAGTV
jgi:hypothetical protein